MLLTCGKSRPTHSDPVQRWIHSDYRQVKASCDGGDASACSFMGALYAYVSHDEPKGRRMWRKACDGAPAGWYACEFLGSVYREHKDDESEATADRFAQRALSQAEKACHDDDMMACAVASQRLGDLNDAGSDRTRVRALTARLSRRQPECDRGDYWACFVVANSQATIDHATAVAKKACRTNDSAACLVAAGNSDKLAAVELFVEGCERGNMWSCAAASWFYFRGAQKMDQEPNPIKAAEYRAEACRLGLPLACDGGV